MYYTQLLNMLNAAIVSIEIAIYSFIAALIISIIFALSLRSKNFAIYKISNGIINLIRAVPEVIILFLVYYGSINILRYFNLPIPGYFVSAVCALALISASYLTAVINSAINAIAAEQIEQALTLNFTKAQTFFYIIAPQLIKSAKPGLINVWLVLLKDTSLLAIIGGSELLRQAQLNAIATHEPMLFYSAAAIIYLSLCFISEKILQAVLPG